ncbi:MAG: hypothetical protein GFH27_549297n75 [Chloroflexi bacterium AL-W]|nr:hypothetical protein [Chloroflexi bacterium AL-N1]NOK68599.1 hypothetical protein [Chloroflexi bacterium AL-N10]NOK76085.1 hypothetical protein [Chloroflexi bacterium AL-N5]NOK82558.1 hypothetical protein [Chloroflexi bacterium AL-W]NOK93356.1 hypothetical protein [Chloroflexi bacterium AL-N15]
MSPLSIRHLFAKIISIFVCVLLLLQSSPLMAGPALSDPTTPSEQSVRQTTTPPLQVTGSPEAGSVTVQVADHFKLVFDADHTWQASEWYDLQSDPTLNLARSDGPTLNYNVIQSPLEVGYDQWYNLENAVDAALTIQSADETAVVLETSWRWEANDGSIFAATATHTIAATGLWHVTTSLTNLSTAQGTRVFTDIQYAFTNGDPHLSWDETLSADAQYFNLARSDGPEPRPSLTVQTSGVPDDFGSDGPVNRYWKVGQTTLEFGESWEANWTNRLSLELPEPPTVRPPTPIEVPPAPGTARAALLEALSIVEALPYAGPPATAPSCPTDAIIRSLRTAVDGTFISDNTLGDERAYSWMVQAATCLEAVAADSNADSAVQESAEQANALIVTAARLIPASSLDATALFGDAIPPEIDETLQLAWQAIADGDDFVTADQQIEAIGAYRIAWGYAHDAIDRLWSATDPDGDQLLDQFEETLGTSTESSDTDGDGISDGDELALTGTDPTQADSDSDNDGDGLTAQEEVAAGTNPLHPDTDRDTLDDRFELEEFGSDPRKQDTDNDGLTDDSEARLGTDPRNPDSDNDGIRDGAETYTSTTSTDEHGLEVAVDITGAGDVAGDIQFQTLISDTLFQDMPGQMAPAVDITTDEPFDNARVAMRFDPAQVPDGDVENLRILYYDDDEKVFKPTDGAHGVDASTGTAWAETSHFTTFVLFYIPNWNTVWTYAMEPGRDPTGPVTRSLDVMLVLDESSSMRTNDPSKLRVTAAQNFVDALLPGDRAGAIGFDTDSRVLQSLTEITPTVRTALSRISNFGDGTCIATGLTSATQEITSTSATETLKAIILLTDGEDTTCATTPDYPAIAADASAANIQIYTIGLGADINEALLQDLANQTGGQYFPISSADDLPEAFRRIAEEPDPTLDTDEDGLPNWLELQGIRLGNGTIVTTDPADFDTDGDGLSDGAEVGTRQTGPDGDYYDGITNPRNPDSDWDGLIDREEISGITDPANADTDGDGLDDLVEIYSGFDPLNTNPDGDGFSDAEEFARDSDPFYYDLTGWEYAAAVVAGFTLGDAGQNMVDLGWLNPAYLQCFGYIAGWLASGFFVIGDIRDTLATLVRGDIADTFLNAIGLIPLLGDGTKVVRVLTQYVNWIANLKGPLFRWVAKQFGSGTTGLVTTQANNTSDILRAALRALGMNNINVGLLDEEIEQLARSGNRLDEISQLLQQTGDKFKLATRSADSLDWQKIDSAVAQYWKLPRRSDYPQLTPEGFNALRGRMYAWARSTEAANEFLISSGYDVLYIGRQDPIVLTNNTSFGLTNGPDIIAVNQATDKTVVVEVKGSTKAGLTLTEELLTSDLQKAPFIQGSLGWLVTDKERYLYPLENAKDPKFRQAANRLKDIINNGLPFETIVFVSARTPNSFGKGVDEIMKKLNDQTTSVQILKYNWP